MAAAVLERNLSSGKSLASGRSIPACWDSCFGTFLGSVEADCAHRDHPCCPSQLLSHWAESASSVHPKSPLTHNKYVSERCKAHTPTIDAKALPASTSAFVRPPATLDAMDACKLFLCGFFSSARRRARTCPATGCYAYAYACSPHLLQNVICHICPILHLRPGPR